MAFDSIADGLAAIRNGEMVVVVDDENRENEGDLICAAQFATPEQINFMATEARGLICLAMEGERLDALELPLMVARNTDENQTAFTVSVDAGPENGVSTGISAEDRARTIQVAIHPATQPADLRRPGHIFPLRARPGGVLKRAGHTEAAVDLSRLAGLYPAGVICEIQNVDGSMARLPQLVAYARRHGLRLINIADLIRYRLDTERFVRRQAEAAMPSTFGQFRAIGYRNELDGSEHVAIVKGHPEAATGPVLVRVHSECLTGDAFGSLRCDCRPQLEAALRMVEAAGEGVVVYLRQEGRGIGLINKLRAYSLQDGGLDTVEANERLGFPADLRSYGVGAQILSDLGVQRLRLITNNPRKIAGLGGYGLQVEDRVPLVMDPGLHNAAYLQTKQAKLGHLMDGPSSDSSCGDAAPGQAALSCRLGPAAVLAWRWGGTGELEPSQLTGHWQELRSWAAEQGMELELEEHPRVLALLDQPSLAVLLVGSSEPGLAEALHRMATWPGTASVSLLLAPDSQRTTHPSNTLEAQRRPLVELAAEQPTLRMAPGTLIRWC
ncbi:bifunctional 3,4-dihydroxy-2-butanone-4-phosphate synthase RibB/GTP cyclohydrolase II RibA [Vulcanococcus limneticus Candia 3F8]|nr:bifunctional 3,4-dihydroxy-2-butanone-4-phosphate synthase/GTP cyclohydrolase II [Vulcanococcus limneticus]MCP9791482.1 bifunctional 3,4-dihydroxy-2-butanone-4-phosphate synthase RibB/GTP cyclohydrolase II RibA [Vulcanococcus limneticus MW73D5]MCP9893361.1 bifunctional 3,4-dihydroxy-2-butanone-4-phosphate synthase RibB/GTP cyclohydrolase II RibA [Vulcanococcus limneticus Candia 3F8]MCP9896729.1 bifunctional 3,4-dihydroxy-2-butanone-4-phosphate synthase RibB/GTP cyclohydrolase II RibA [Vulcano